MKLSADTTGFLKRYEMNLESTTLDGTTSSGSTRRIRRRAHVMARTIIKMLVNESHLELSVLCLMVRDDKVLLDATGADHILPLYNEKSSCSTVTTITNT
jgi:hypothetical protein